MHEQTEREDEQERIYGLVDDEQALAPGSEKFRRMTRFYTCDELGEIESFRQNYPMVKTNSRQCRNSAREVAWGDPSAGNGARNCWAEVDATGLDVRGATYLEDGLKQPSMPSLGKLLVVDLFEADVDVPCLSRSVQVGIVQRLRRAGEQRQLFVVNFRVVPLHLVGVWALPRLTAPDGLSVDPSTALLKRFIEDMTPGERTKHLKVIPHCVEGPWVARRTVGTKPAILGKNIPIDYFAVENCFEVSVNIGASRTAQRVASIMSSSAKSLHLDMAFVIEGKDEAELPERILGGFGMVFPDLGSARVVDIV